MNKNQLNDNFFQNRRSDVRGLIFGLLFTVTLSACNKGDFTNINGVSPNTNDLKLAKTAQMKFRTNEEAKSYLNQRLNSYAEVIVSLARDEKFRAIVNASVARKFDGDYNVLLQDLAKLLKDQKYTNELYLNELKSFQAMIEEPVIINGRESYPQIYIPFFGDEAITSRSSDPCLISPAGEPNYPNPVIVPFDGDETKKQSVFEGISFDKNGKEMKVSQVSECFAKRHTVWAITLNERGGPEAPARVRKINDETKSLNTLNVIDTAANRPNIYIGSMALKMNKESWIKGGSEVEGVWLFSWYNGRNPLTGNISFQVYDPFYDGSGHTTDEIELGFFTRSEVSNQTYKWLNVGIGNMSTWRLATYNIFRYPSQGNYMYLCIYERDDQRWETTNVYAADGNFMTTLNFLSNENPFILATIKIIPNGATDPAPNTSTFYVNTTNEIRFNTAHR